MFCVFVGIIKIKARQNKNIIFVDDIAKRAFLRSETETLKRFYDKFNSFPRVSKSWKRHTKKLESKKTFIELHFTFQCRC